MTRTFTGKRVLESGPMSLRQFSAALGVDAKLASSTLAQLIKTGVAQRATAPGARRYVYRLAA
jgi:DNA-binding transcriptional regulator GbsR (MarR family)